uniref:DUF6461 domain-containing protein n=1 Tax=Paractinoplanes polyasparticus TaxID=2856853 RepID=UPI001C863034|nr:DUF6461 domain-containing protein [Actinoplanes polyasparticus]
MDNDWAWATHDDNPGFCLTFVRDRDPATVAHLLGGGPPQSMTREDATHTYPLTLPGSVLRLGATETWTYCYEDRAPTASRKALRERLSDGTDVVQVVKSGDGMTIARRLNNGRTLEQFEPGPTAAPRGDHPAILLELVNRALTDRPHTGRLAAALHAAGEYVGAVVTRQDLDGPLPTSYSTHPPHPTPPPSTPAPAGLGRRLATIAIPGQPGDHTT